MQRDVTTQPILGPALRVGQQLLQWEGPPTAKAQNPLEVRVLFESSVGERITSHLDMENCGTTAIYYSWQVCYCPRSLCIASFPGLLLPSLSVYSLVPRYATALALCI